MWAHGCGVEVRLISRSSHETYSRCPRQHYYGHLYKGTGLEGRVKPLNLALGLSLHMGMETLFKTGDLGEALRAVEGEWTPLSSGYAPEGREEGLAMAQALLMGWYRVRYETFREEWDVISIEQEGLIPLSPAVGLQFRADLVARSKLDERVYVFNWKTSGSSGARWSEEWEADIQMWTEALAVEQALGEPVEGCIVEGFLKGNRKYGRWSSPLVWAFRLRTPQGPYVYSPFYERPGVKTEWDPDRGRWKGPWHRFPTWKEVLPNGEVGLEGWINWLPEDVLAAQFPRSLPIRRPPGVVERWLKSVIRREEDVAHVLQTGSEEDRESFFYPNISKWNCGECAFRPICLEGATPQQMMEAGLLVERVDHHGPARDLGR